MDPLTAGFIGSGISGLFGLAGSSSTNAANKDIAEMNIEYQKETNAKNEALMRESWTREDNAVQRRAKDLTMAGMSPLLAAGASAQAGQVVSYKAPESHQVVQKSGLEGAISGIYQGMMQMQSYMDMMAKQQQVQINQGQLALNKSDQYIRDQFAPHIATGYSIENKNKLADLKLKDIGLRYADRIKALQLMQQLQDFDTSKYNYDMSNKYGLRTNESGNTITKTAQQLTEALERIGSEIFGGRR